MLVGGENINCMRKIGLLFLLLAIGTIAFSQEITVRFTGQLNNSEYCRLDSVKITNLTRNWTETVEYPDTIIVLGGTVDANMNIVHTQGLGQNAPNPFNCKTRVELSVSQQENVRMQLLDATGKLCAEYYSSLDVGVHNFDISASMPQTYMLNAMVGSRSYSIRMVNVGKGCGNSIKYAGISGGIIAKLTSTNDFQIGDNMQYVGYTAIVGEVVASASIEHSQTASEDLTLDFIHCTNSYGTDAQIACDSYEWIDGNTYTESTNEPTFTLTNNEGCDSVVTLHLTIACPPIVQTNAATDITSTSATLMGYITSDGGVDVTDCGFLYGTSENDLFQTVTSGDNTGSYMANLDNLTPYTTYYYKAYATNRLGTSYGEVMSFTTLISTGTLNGHDYVDLGLPSGICWATSNVGANSPTDYGTYFAWGETTTKETYNWETYIYANGTTDDDATLTKYTGSDNLTVLEASDDAAIANWGSGWRMPAQTEINELYNNCAHEWTTQNGVNGRLFTGPNGNSIFLPAAGYRRNSELRDAGSYGYYWSSSLISDYPGNAWTIRFYSNNCYTNYGGTRSWGFTVRPVCDQ